MERLELEGGYVDVRAALIEDAGGVTLSHTKSEAGVRVVGIPSVVLPELRQHMQRWAEPGPDGRVFVGPKGSTPRRKTFNVAWKSALKRAEASGTPMPDGLRFHDLRHVANGFAAARASIRELMARMGHSTMRAALIYQHARRDREREIADAVSERLAEALNRRPR